MSELYWITRFGSLHNIGIAMCWVFLLIAVILWIASISKDEWTGEDCCTEKQKNLLRKKSKYSLAVSVIGVLMWIFIPTQEEAYFIYGVGGTMDYIKSNPTAKQIPDKCIKALDKWIDSWSYQKNDSVKISK